MIVVNFIISLLNLLIKGLGAVLNLLFSFLPSSPFNYLDSSSISEYLSGLNYFIPISTMISISELWLSSIGIYYLYQIAMRWVKAIN